jgi:hypothetical protein
MLAHQSGWDETLMALAAVGVVVGTVVWARRRRERHPETATGHCLYCGVALPEGAERCDACGFKVKG